jgi:quercetin dioxygenase-like cupin family protein
MAVSVERDLELVERALGWGELDARPSPPDRALEREAAALAALLGDLAAREAAEPPRSLRERVLAAVRSGSQLDGFAPRLAALLDWPPARAEALLREGAEPAGPRWIDGPAPRIRIRPLKPGPRHGTAVAGLIWCEPGSVFPAHRHHGPELALVLSGRALNSGGERWSVGDPVLQPAGSTHSFAVPRGELPLLAAVVVRTGFELV